MQLSVSMPTEPFRSTVLLGSLLAAGCSYPETTEYLDPGHMSVDMTVVAHSSESVNAVVQLGEYTTGALTLELGDSDSLWLSRNRPVSDYIDPDNLIHGLAEAGENIAGFDATDYASDSFIDNNAWSNETDDTPPYRADIEPGGADRFYIGYVSRHGDNALNSYVTLPRPFSITAPLPDERLSRANNTVVNWQTGGEVDEVRIRAKSACNDQTGYDYSRTVGGDPGTFTIPGGSLDTSAGSCPVTIEITKRVAGTLDPAFDNGRVTGRRVDTVTVTSTD